MQETPTGVPLTLDNLIAAGMPKQQAEKALIASAVAQGALSQEQYAAVVRHLLSVIGSQNQTIADLQKQITALEQK
jgi:hypothetical protein